MNRCASTGLLALDITHMVSLVINRGLGLPVGQHFGAGAVGQVVLRVQHVAAPCVGDRGAPSGIVW